MQSCFHETRLGFWLDSKFPSIDKIGRVGCPVLAVHGDRDRIVPIALGRELFEAAPEPKAFHTVAGAGHNDLVIVGGRPYFARLGTFLDEVAP